MTGCFLSTVGEEPFAPGFRVLVVVERFISDLNLSAGDQLSYWYGGDALGVGPVFERATAPTVDELKVWADSDAMQPMQDWDVMIWDSDELADQFFELARAGACRKNRYFLHLLYGRVGGAVRSDRVDSSIRQLVERSARAGDQGLGLLAERAQYLLENPATFDYGDWCE